MRSYEYVCASCVPGGTCPCGSMPVHEECDGADLGGRSCTSLGFLRGTLRCTAHCTLDKSDGTSTPAPGAGQVLTQADVPQGRDFAMALNGHLLGMAATETGATRFSALDAATLGSGGISGVWAPPPNYPSGAVGMMRVQGAWYDPLWSPVVAPLGDGFLYAAEHAASSAYTVVTFRACPRGIGQPLGRFPGRD